MIIYKATNLQNGKCYIGKTTKTLEFRKTQHLERSKRLNFAFYNAIRKYGEENFKWEIVDNVDSEEELNLKETYYIGYFNSLCPNGYNMTLGGDGQSGLKHSAITKEKLRVSMIDQMKKGRKHHMLGKKHNEITRVKMSESAKKRKRPPMSQETKNKIAERLKGSNNGMYNKTTHNANRVLCIETGVIYESVRKASKETGIFNIDVVCRGKRKKAGGYSWKYI